MVLDDSVAISVDRCLTASSSTSALHAEEGIVAVEDGGGRMDGDDEQGSAAGESGVGREWLKRGEGMK
jgi:hypothetical protein